MFLVLCLPRSRSAWLAHFLAYGKGPIGHETLMNCRSVDDFLQFYKDGMLGTVETAGAVLWRIVRKEMPDCKIVLIRRPLVEVYKSLAKAGIVGDLSDLAEQDAMLDAAAQDPMIVSIQSEQLSDPAACSWLFQHCLETEFDIDWWFKLNALNIQVDMPVWLEAIRHKKDDIDAFLMDARTRTEKFSNLLQ